MGIKQETLEHATEKSIGERKFYLQHTPVIRKLTQSTSEADYTEIFSPVYRDKISAQPSDKTLEKRSSRLHEESFSQVWARRAEKSHVIARKNFSPCWKDDWQAW